MTSPAEGKAAQGLRERKKARTKAAIQRHAVRLFRAQGYGATTVEQIAAAAEVAPSTVFRYFPTKEELVRTNVYEPLIRGAFEAQPPGVSLVQAWRHAIRAAIAGLSATELTEQRERELLLFAAPELWAASLANVTRLLDTVAELSAARVGRAPHDPAVRTVAGAVCGVLLAVMLDWVRRPDLDVATATDEALAHLDAGLPL